MSDGRPSGNKSLLGILLGIAAFTIAALGMLVFLNSCRTAAPVAPDMSTAAARALVHRKNVALGQLENQKVNEGIEAFTEIAEKVPADPLGPRNLAVARVLALGSEDQAAPPEAIAAAREALADLKQVEGEANDYHWLAYRVAVSERNFDKADAALAALCQAEPKNAAAWYARFRVARLANGSSDGELDLAPLDQAYELNPNNAWLLVEWLRATGTELLATADEAAPSTAEAQKKLVARLQLATPTAQAFSYVIKAHTRADVNDLLQQAIDAAQANTLSVAGGTMLKLANVLLPHSTPDQQPVQHHPLESVLDQFQPAFYETYAIAESEPTAPIEVSFTSDGAWQIPAELQAAVGELRDCVVVDFDLDGQLEVIALGTKSLVVWARGADSAWHELTSFAADGFSHVIAQDLDADFDETIAATQPTKGDSVKPVVTPALRGGCPTADVDVVLYGSAGVQVLENVYNPATKTRSLRAVAAKLPTALSEVTCVALADLEADGDLDLVLGDASGLHLWSNSGNFTFADISDRSLLPEGDLSATQLLPLDWDRDVDIDLLVAAPDHGGWLENLRHGQFRWHAFEQDVASLANAKSLEVVSGATGGGWTIIAAGAAGCTALATKSLLPGVVRFGAMTPITKPSVERVTAIDYDNDGYDDLLLDSDGQLRLFRGLTDGSFAQTEVLDRQSSVKGTTNVASANDIDADGDLDLVLLSDWQLKILLNQGGNKNHWIDVALQAQQVKGQQHSPSGRISPYGVGSHLELKAGTRYQRRIVGQPATHFGLGSVDKADVIRVLWLNGVPQNVIQPAADTFVCEQQILTGSCPYLYTWNGERFVFITDLLWNAPLGLQLAEGVTATPREWEYIKIRGESLVVSDGKYRLQLTEELWEAVYFDEVQLIAIDHPSSVEIYSNEKVGPAEIAPFLVHTVRQEIPPIRAVNQRGRDLLPEILHRDGKFAQPYDRKLRQGIAEEHFTELDFGDLGEVQGAMLFLTGWMYPPSTSINVAASQGDSITLPRPPALLVPDDDGQWQEVLPFMGFPGGKTKTIAVDVAKFLNPRDARMRIATSMEICWDQIFLRINETDVECRQSTLPLLAADLHYRGFSRISHDAFHGPEHFTYDEVSTAPKWPPMAGAFTRWGDVKPLLTASDDQLLVLGAGDEATLTFEAIPVPDGWRRDFFIYSVGWDKDANLDTVAGAVVEPLPFRGMASYPWPAHQIVPHSREYMNYLQAYQTRYLSQSFWNVVREFDSATAETIDRGAQNVPTP